MSEQVKQLDEKFCSSCGAIIKKEAAICVKCGVAQRPEKGAGASDRSWGILLGLWFIACHRFYAGKIGTGILYWLTAGGLGIWTLVDLIFICSRKFKDSKGNLII